MQHLILSNDLDRRVFIKGLGFISLGIIAGTLGGCEELAEQIRNRPTRRRLRTGSPEVDADIATYRQAVNQMKGLDTSNPADPRGWKNQSIIHGVPEHFNFCEHGTDHFFDWHRGYLFYFEKICQKLTGNSHFGLPYWNWNQDPAIHSAFLDTTSPLFLARNRTSMSGSSSITTAELDPIFDDTNFFTFGSQLEGTPHNNVHTFIGGTMGGSASALDPLFWMHHCMVDYCWAKWNIELGNDNTNNEAWINRVNSHFVDADGNEATAYAGISTLMPLLSYQYESSAIGSHPAAAPIRHKREFQRLEARIRRGADIKFEVKQRIPIAERTVVSIARPLSRETKLLPSNFAKILNEERTPEHVFASIEYAQLPSTSDFAVRVFVNLPNANKGTPVTDPHYAGSFAFFGTEAPNVGDQESAGHKHRPKFLVNLTNTLRRLRKSGEVTDNSSISVQLVAVPFSGTFEKEDTQLLLDKLEIIVTPVILHSQ